jgi:hypothetical protein
VIPSEAASADRQLTRPLVMSEQPPGSGKSLEEPVSEPSSEEAEAPVPEKDESPTNIPTAGWIASFNWTKLSEGLGTPAADKVRVTQALLAVIRHHHWLFCRLSVGVHADKSSPRSTSFLGWRSTRLDSGGGGGLDES